MDRYDPDSSIAVRLDGVGYHTAYVGKFLNGLARNVPIAKEMEREAVGWDDFEVIWENQGEYYHYRWWTRDGVVERGGHAVGDLGVTELLREIHNADGAVRAGDGEAPA